MTRVSPNFAIGIDIGGTNSEYGIVNHRGEILIKGKIRTDGYDTVEPFIEELYDSLSPIIDSYRNDGNIVGIGVGAPNANFYKGIIEYAPNLRWKGTVHLAKLIAEKFDLPCLLTNDANAAAMGEMIYGAARGLKDFVMLTLGTGMGSGIVSNGQLVYGLDGYAGELGHTIIIRNGRKHWKTDLRGSLESYVSATGVKLTAIEMMESSDAPSSMRNLDRNKLDSKRIYECAILGDAMAIEVFRFTGQLLGEAMANFVMATSPEAIILFGGVIKAGDLFLAPARQHLELNVLPMYKNKVKIIFSELNEADAAILGASTLVWDMPHMKKISATL